MKRNILILLAFLPLFGFGQLSLTDNQGRVLTFSNVGLTWVQPIPSYSYFNINYLYAPHATTPTYFETFVSGDSSAIHPDVLDMYQEIGVGETWNGYRYWMCFTPLPEINPDANENPSIVASNDLNNWVIPTGLINPIKKQPCISYNSDADLYFENDTLYLIYRTWSCTPATSYVEMKSSTDGITWNSDSTNLVTFIINTSVNELISPSILKDNGFYYIYSVKLNSVDTTTQIRRYRSSTLSNFTLYDTINLNTTGTFTESIAKNVSGRNFRIWHVNVNKYGSKIYLSYYLRTNTNQYYYGAVNNYIAVSDNGKDFTQAKYPLFVRNYDTQIESNTGNNWWDLGYYRPSMLMYSDSIVLFYSGWAGDWEDYPTYIGHTTLKLRDTNAINIANPYNSMSDFRLTRIDSANSKLGQYTFCDDFNRPDASVIGTSSCGETYAGGGGGFAIVDSFLVRTGTALSYLFFDADSTNFEGEVNLSVNQAVFTVTGSYLITLKANGGSQLVKLQIANYNTLILTFNGIGSKELFRVYRNYINIADLNSIRWRIDGARIRVWINGVLNIDYTLVVGDVSNQAELDAWLTGKRVYMNWSASSGSTAKIKNITLRNL